MKRSNRIFTDPSNALPKLKHSLLGAPALRAWTCLALVALPIASIQYARGVSIPPREPPGLSDASSATNGAAPFSATPASSGGSASVPQAQGDTSVDALADKGAEFARPSAALDAAATFDGESGVVAAQPAIEATDITQAAAPPVSADAPDSAATQESESITIVVNEPDAQHMPNETQAQLAPPHAAAMTEAITEIHPSSDTALAAAQTGQDSPKTRRSARRAKPALLAKAEVEGSTTQTRGLGKLDPIDARHTSRSRADSLEHTDPRAHTQLLGGRGVAQIADLGRGSPMAGAAADVFAAGHHVVTRASCEHYQDNPYFDQDPFGNSRPQKCP